MPGSMPDARSSARTASNRIIWRAVNGLSGSSATGQCVHTPSSSTSESSPIALASGTTSAGAAPTRCMPVSTLRCTGTAGARWARTDLAIAATQAAE